MFLNLLNMAVTLSLEIQSLWARFTEFMLQACITTKQISSITRCKTEKSSSPTCACVDSKRFCVQQIKRDIMFFSNYDSSSSPFKLAKLCRRTLVVAITKK